MKSFLILLLLLTACFPSLMGQWEIINEGLEDYESFYNGSVEIELVSKDAGWLTNEVSILKTINGGQTWNQVSWDLGYIVDCEFIDDSVCWVISERHDFSEPAWPFITRLYKTNDGGNNWVNMLDMGRSHEAYYAKILFASEDIIVVATRELSMIKSTDGGSTWEDITPAGYEEYAEHLNSISFTGSDTGVYIKQVNSYSFALARTTDGGSTWEERHLPQFQNIREIGFIDHQTGYLLAQIGRGWSGASNYVICITEDAFNTWTVATKNQYPIWNCHFFNNQVGLAILEDGKRSKIVKTFNGGRSWVECESPGFFDFGPSGLNFGNDSTGIIFSQKCWVCGNAFSVLKSTDQGDTWSILHLSYPFKDVCFLDKQNGFAVGGDAGEASSFGDILKTNNGGKSWSFIHSGPSPILKCNFVNESIGFAQARRCVQQGLYSTNLYQTSDGGKCWFVYPHEFSPDTRITFINELMGFALNDLGLFLTISGGEYWDRLISSEANGLLHLKDYMTTIVSSDESTFWGIVDENSIIRFTIEGAWEKIELETEQSLYKIFFKDENTGWISTGNYWANGLNDFDPPTSTLFKTEDGGNSWTKIDYPYQIRDICFKDMQYGWAVGRDSMSHGVILETTDGGKNWVVQVDSLSVQLRALEYKDGVVWAVGDHGFILKMYDSNSTTAIKNQSASVDQDFTFHISPNPAHSIIEIEMENQGNYTIELVSLNGQVLEVIMLSGTNCSLDLSLFQEGIYFINIRSKDFAATRKIIKL